MRLMRTSEISQRPVVTMAGEDVAQVKDVVYSSDGGAVEGFTLAGRGIFSGPLKQGLAWTALSALGANAVMIEDEDVLEPVKDVVERSRRSGSSAGNVIGAQVLTDAGVGLGTVNDVIVSVGPRGSACDVVGYEIAASEGLGTQGELVLIPLPDTISASGEHLMVPASAREFVGRDLAGFGASIDAFRAQLGGAS